MRSTNLMLMTILTWSLNEATTIYKEVLVNAKTHISCIPDKDMQIQWQHIPPGGSKDKPISVYAEGRFNVSSNRGFRMEKDSNTGPYHLIIPNAKYDDAGLYECKEDVTGSGEFGSTHLTVLESNPKCESDMKPDGYVGPNTCKLQRENMIFTCAVSFSGIPPQMIWKNLNNSQSFNESKSKNETGQLTSSLIIRADSLYDGTIFNCQSTKSDAKCSTEIIKIQYFESDKPLVKKNVGDKVNCSANSNQLLEFKWTVLQGTQYLPVIKNQELLIPSPGFYRCEVKYRIRKAECASNASEVDVPNNCVETESVGTTAIIVLAVILGICVAVIIALIVCCCIQKRKHKPKEIPITKDKGLLYDSAAK